MFSLYFYVVNFKLAIGVATSSLSVVVTSGEERVATLLVFFFTNLPRLLDLLGVGLLIREEPLKPRRGLNSPFSEPGVPFVEFRPLEFLSPGIFQ